MESKPVRYFRKLLERVLEKALKRQVLWICVLCLVVGCAEEVLGPGYIVSPYTEKTIEFFGRSGSDDWPNVLETIEIEGQKHVLRRQAGSIRINLSKYTIETVPDHLAQDIEFVDLTIRSCGQFDPVVLNKILTAFGTIYAATIRVCDLEDSCLEPADNNTQLLDMCAPGMALEGCASNTLELPAQEPRCVLKIKHLRMFGTGISAIRWFQERVDLSQSWINLEIMGGLKLESLEVLDGFNALGVSIVWLTELASLDSMDCKLLQAGPLPDVLVIHTLVPVAARMSEEIVQNMLNKEWVGLNIPMNVFEELMKPSNQPKNLSANKLMVYTPRHSPDMEDLGTPLPPMGDNQLLVESLTVYFYNTNGLATHTDLIKALSWTAGCVRGLVKLIVENQHPSTALEDFVKNNKVVIATNPALTSIRACNIECLYMGGRKQPVLCFSLEGWKRCTGGDLPKEMKTKTRKPVSGAIRKTKKHT
ncbi:hypothetical protein NEDG_01777 [Nematocida displodere]|uniref:Uncharacterized protein n=1 Tax=Nematocida displodere TaxID=1805483 RepID=A0A177EJY9_9MICR|nr:hypothetical protein NEDG_01777 [Nematocida displodere]